MASCITSPTARGPQKPVRGARFIRDKISGVIFISYGDTERIPHALPPTLVGPTPDGHCDVLTEFEANTMQYEQSDFHVYLRENIIMSKNALTYM